MAIIQALGCITIIMLNPHLALKFCLKRLPLKMYKFGSVTLYALMHDNMDNPLHSFGMIECIVCELIHAKTKLLPFQMAWASNSSWFQIYDGGYMCVS
jgi:hypothetical protein